MNLMKLKAFKCRAKVTGPCLSMAWQFNNQRYYPTNNSINYQQFSGQRFHLHSQSTSSNRVLSQQSLDPLSRFSDSSYRATLCRFHGSAKGCRNSATGCRYSHDHPNSVPFCQYFISSEGCRYGHNCKYRHQQFPI